MTTRLLHTTISHDTLQCVEALVDGVKTGDIVGAAIGIIYKRKRYSVTLCGEARHDPTYTRGVVGAIEDELRDLIHERSQGDTTI